MWREVLIIFCHYSCSLKSTIIPTFIKLIATLDNILASSKAREEKFKGTKKKSSLNKSAGSLWEFQGETLLRASFTFTMRTHAFPPHSPKPWCVLFCSNRINYTLQGGITTKSTRSDKCLFIYWKKKELHNHNSTAAAFFWQTRFYFALIKKSLQNSVLEREEEYAEEEVFPLPCSFCFKVVCEFHRVWILMTASYITMTLW